MSQRAGWWWVPIALLGVFALLVPSTMVVVVTSKLFLAHGSEIPLVLSVFASNWVWRAVFVGFRIQILLTLLSPVPLYFDRQCVAAHSDWTPSLFYFLMAFPLHFFPLISVVYLYNRRRHLGTP